MKWFIIRKKKKKMEILQNKSLTLTNFYYSLIRKNVDCFKYLETANTIDYLLDNGFTSIEIINELKKHNADSINYNILSDTLWKNSLIKKGAFYLHRELRLESPAPQYDPISNLVVEQPFYCEMKIRYYEKNVVNYFLSKLSNSARQLEDMKTDLGAVKYLMSKYSRIDYVEPLDIILCSIDNHLEQEPNCYRLIDISNTNQTTIDILVSDMLTLESQDNRKMVPRKKCST